MPEPTAAASLPRLTYLRIRNYRALRDLELRDLTPLTVFIGPNGSGKSTVLDALAFLAEAVSGNLQQAWQDRDRFRGMRTRGSDGPISFEIRVLPLGAIDESIYKVDLGEEDNKVYVINEWVQLAVDDQEKKVFKAKHTPGTNYSEIASDTIKSDTTLNGNEQENLGGRVLMGSTIHLMLGYAFAFNLKVSEYTRPILDYLESYRYIHLTDDHLKGYSDAGPREKLSANGDNLPNVLYYLHTKHPEVLARITAQMRRWVPSLADIITEITSDERLLLRFKDAPFEKPLPAQYMSEGTMRLAALLTLLYEPNAAGMLGLEEPENELHPRLLPRLAEELVKATEMRQLFVATHSPALLNAFEPEQVWVLHRGADGYTQATRTADLPDVVAMVEEGSKLGYLWSHNFFDVGDPLAPHSSQPAQQ